MLQKKRVGEGREGGERKWGVWMEPAKSAEMHYSCRSQQTFGFLANDYVHVSAMIYKRFNIWWLDFKVAKSVCVCGDHRSWQPL